jgi:hypothetical protein
MNTILEYTTLIILGLLVLSAFSIADLLKKAGYVNSRLYIFNLLPYIEGAKKMYGAGDSNMRFWVKLFFICGVLIIPLSILELLLNVLGSK